jgi:putative ABC transport system permease protein
MQIRPIFSALMRNKASLILIGAQVALTLAILCNALFIINQRLAHMQRPSGMNEADTFIFGSTGFAPGFNQTATLQADLALMRQLAGVVAVTPANAVPMSNGGWGSGIRVQPNQKTDTAQTAVYFIDDHGLDAYGVKLIAGRNFEPAEVSEIDIRQTPHPAVVILSKALADVLFPDGDALGKPVYPEENQPPATIIGIVERMQAPWVDQEDRIENSTFVPGFLVGTGIPSGYLVRAQAGRRDEMMKTIEQKLAQSNTGRVIGKMRSMEEVRSAGYARDRMMAIILAAVVFALLAITALGIVGMASFWVAQRTKQIGTRRALGATRGDILRYFQTENFIITTLGLIVGGILAYAFSFWLMQHYQAPRLPWHYVPIGVVCLWLLGPLAVLGPALRATRVPPVVATRSL